MDQDGNIIKAFESADEDRRLSLFLTHRDLRPQFTDIYMTEKALPKRSTSKHFSGLKGNSRCHRLADLCLGWLKCCRS